MPRFRVSLEERMRRGGDHGHPGIHVYTTYMLLTPHFWLQGLCNI